MLFYGSKNRVVQQTNLMFVSSEMVFYIYIPGISQVVGTK